MKSKHARTLTAIYTKPTLGGIVFADIESLVVTLGGSIFEGAGSSIAFELHGTRRYLHRPPSGQRGEALPGGGHARLAQRNGNNAMTNAMTYKGYFARIDFDGRDNIFVGHVLGVDDKISFHGETVADLTRNFHVAVDHYLDECKRTNRKPQKPASGKVMLRLNPETHTAVSIAAAVAGESVNQWSEEVLGRAAREVLQRAAHA
jgi:predicted HicB family RNase H-like nuclease